jgi:hypothetical protein
MPNPPLILQSSSVLLKFSREGDRFTHRIVRRQEQGDLDCVESFSGASGDEWPRDPPLQQLVVEQVGSPSRTVALGVGMTNPGHWSVAVEAVGPRADRLEFDWACRIQRAADYLGSTYRTLPRPELQRRLFTEPHAEWPIGNGQALILLVTDGKLVWHEEQQTISIEPTSDIRSKGTHCWRYCFWVE